MSSPVQVDQLFLQDCLAGLGGIPPEYIHAMITDIPYGIGADDWDVLHANTNSAYMGSSPAQAKANKAFSRRGKPLNGWSSADREISKEYEVWCTEWLQRAYPALKPGASVLIFAGRRYSHRVMSALENAGYTVKDQIAWIKPQAVHRAQRLSVVYEKRGDEDNAEAWRGWRLGNLRPRFEPIVWATKPYKIGTTIADNVLSHGVGGYNPTALERFSRDSANVFEVGMPRDEKKIHPTQKPLALMSALVDLVTQEGQVVLDPFAGSATTLVAAKMLGRRYIGFEKEQEYFDLAMTRLGSEDKPQRV